MKLWKNSILSVSMIILLLSCVTASAVSDTDPPGDVVHATWATNTWGYASVGSKPNIDITGISADTSSGKLTMTLTVVGPIGGTENYSYVVVFNTTDAMYMMTYSGFGIQKEGMAWGIPKNGDYMNMSYGNVTVVGTTTVQATLNLSGPDTTKVVLYGLASEYNGNPSVNPYADYWVDVAGDKPDYTTNQGTGGGGTGGTNGSTTKPSTPGFEAVAAIAAIGVAFILLKRRK